MKSKMTTIKKMAMAAMMLLVMVLTFVYVGGTAEAYEIGLGKISGKIKWRSSYNYTKTHHGTYGQYIGQEIDLVNLARSGLNLDAKCKTQAGIEKISYRILKGKKRAKFIPKPLYTGTNGNLRVVGKCYDLYFKKPGKVQIGLYVKYKGKKGIQIHKVTFNVSKPPTSKTLTMTDGTSKKFYVGPYSCKFTKSGIVELSDADPITGYATIKALKPGTTYLKVVVKNNDTHKTVYSIKKKIVVKEPTTWKKGGYLANRVGEKINNIEIYVYEEAWNVHYYIGGTTAPIVSVKTDKPNYKVKEINRHDFIIKADPRKGDGSFTVTVELANGETLTCTNKVFDSFDDYCNYGR